MEREDKIKLKEMNPKQILKQKNVLNAELLKTKENIIELENKLNKEVKNEEKLTFLLSYINYDYNFDISLQELIKIIQSEFKKTVTYKVNLDNAYICTKSRKWCESSVINYFKQRNKNFNVEIHLLIGENEEVSYGLIEYNINDVSFTDGRTFEDVCYVSYEMDDSYGTCDFYNDLNIKDINLENLICHFKYRNLNPDYPGLSEIKKIVNKLILNYLENKEEQQIKRVRK